MKHFTLLLFAGIVLTACNNQPASNGAILVDVTLPQQRIIDSQAIAQLAHIDNCLYGEHMVRVKSLSGYEYNKTQSFTLPSHFAVLSNPYNRSEEIRYFIWLINHELDAYYADNSDIKTSSLYNEIVREANTIATSQATYKYVIVQSDLSENTEAFSIYKQQSLLVAHPDSVLHILERNVKCLDLTGVSMYFIFQPTTQEENKRFVLMSNFFKKIFEEHHATVFVGANL